VLGLRFVKFFLAVLKRKRFALLTGSLRVFLLGRLCGANTYKQTEFAPAHRAADIIVIEFGCC
jgi:hypothetical protein